MSETRHWVTTSTTRLEPIVNPMAAACRDGFVPTHVSILDNPGVHGVTEAAETLIKTVVTAAGGTTPTVSVETIDDETDYAAIVDYLADAVGSAKEDGAEVAIDITPGRKFWSFISFQAGLRHGVDHLYYVHLDGEYFGESFPTIPRTAIELVDFTEVLDAD